MKTPNNRLQVWRLIYSSRYSDSSSSDSESLEYESSDEEQDPLYENAQINRREQTLAVMSFSVRHHLSLSQLSDLLELMKLHCQENNRSERNVANMQKVLSSDLKLKYHDVCNQRYRMFSGNTAETQCATDGCTGLVLKSIRGQKGGGREGSGEELCFWFLFD